MVTSTLQRYLSVEGFSVRTAPDWQSAQNLLNKTLPDLVILDLGLPDASGLDATRELRQTSDVGIIVLTGSRDRIDRIVGLETGADDYVEKPFDDRELVARIRTVLRRLPRQQRDNVASLSNEQPGADETQGRIVRIGEWTLDLLTGDLCDADGEQVSLTQGELQLLELLVKNLNKIVSREMICQVLYGMDWNPDTRRIDAMVVRLRKKLEPDPSRPKLIKSIRGRGYILLSGSSVVPFVDPTAKD